MTKPADGADELFIHLNVAGLAALLKAVEAAMIDGRGHLSLRTGTGMTVTCRSSSRFTGLTVAFVDPHGPSDDDRWTGRPDPEPLPRTPALELRG